MTHDRFAHWLHWAGRLILLALCVLTGILWGRMDRQVRENRADIAMLQAYSDAQTARLQAEAAAEQAFLERRWKDLLMPLLREHHDALEALDAPMAPLPEWLQPKESP